MRRKALAFVMLFGLLAAACGGGSDSGDTAGSQTAAQPDTNATVRVAANRRDRFTARLPMLRRPHPEGGVGAVRVEVRGRRGSGRDVAVLGSMDRPGVAAGAVAALAAAWIGDAQLGGPGASGLAPRVAPVPFLAELARRGVKAASFVGADAAQPPG